MFGKEVKCPRTEAIWRVQGAWAPTSVQAQRAQRAEQWGRCFFGTPTCPRRQLVICNNNGSEVPLLASPQTEEVSRHFHFPSLLWWRRHASNPVTVRLISHFFHGFCLLAGPVHLKGQEHHVEKE